MIEPRMVAKILVFLKTETVEIRAVDRVNDVVAGVAAGRIKAGRQFARAINDFTCEELERLSSALLQHYIRKFQ
jgi:hypothetical protein